MFRLKEVLKEKNVTAKDLALRVGLTPVVLSRYINGSSSPTLNTMERLAKELEIDVVDLIKEPDGNRQGRPRRRTEDERYIDAYRKMISYCKYYHGEAGCPIKYRGNTDIQTMRSIEQSICSKSYMTMYDTGGNGLRDEFYLNIASEFNRKPDTYLKYMQLYFGDRPKILNKLYNIFGHPEEVVKKN